MIPSVILAKTITTAPPLLLSSPSSSALSQNSTNSRRLPPPHSLISLDPGTPRLTERHDTRNCTHACSHILQHTADSSTHALRTPPSWEEMTGRAQGINSEYTGHWLISCTLKCGRCSLFDSEFHSLISFFTYCIFKLVGQCFDAFRLYCQQERAWSEIHGGKLAQTVWVWSLYCDHSCID